MTIIFQLGENFWIEYHEITLSIPDAAGFVDSAVTNLDRPGTFLGISFVQSRAGGNLDNLNELAPFMVLNQGSAGFSFGDTLTGIIMRSHKAAGTSGARTVGCHVLIFMRGRNR